MSFRNTDVPYEVTQFFQSWEDLEQLAGHSIRRLRSKGGVPVANLDQLADLSPRIEEMQFVVTAYDRFSPRLKSNRSVQPQK